ncbi:unnamed protein product [Arabidopsis halleri]
MVLDFPSMEKDLVSRGARRKQIELEEARKAGLAPAEVDENGEEIIPHVPDLMLKASWYYTTSETPSLKHQKNWKHDPFCTDASSSYDRGAKIYQAETYRKGACEKYALLPPLWCNTHDAKACTERPRKLGAKFTSKNIAPDEKIQSLKLNYDGNRDRWNGYDSSTYHRVQEIYDAKEDARKKYLKDEKLKKLEEKHKHQEVNDPTSDWDEEDDDLRVDEAKVDGSKQMDFAKDMHMQAAPSRAEFLYKKVKAGKDKLKSQTKDAIMGKYGNAATQDEILMELLLGQSKRQVEYDLAGRILKGHVVVLPKSKYKEDVHVNNHNSVWGSWWKGHKWGYKCCQLTVRNRFLHSSR